MPFTFFSLLLVHLSHQFTFPPICIYFSLVSWLLRKERKIEKEKKRHLWIALFFCTQSRMWSGISTCLKSQPHLCFWLGLNQLEINLSLNSNGLMRRIMQMQQKLLTLPITSLVWMLESITHSASLLWQQINQHKEKLSASHNLPVCKLIKYMFCTTKHI